MREENSKNSQSKDTFRDGKEGMFIEVNLRNTKLLMLGTNHLSNQPDDSIFEFMVQLQTKITKLIKHFSSLVTLMQKKQKLAFRTICGKIYYEMKISFYKTK